MSNVPYAGALRNLMYVMLCTQPDICFAVGLVSHYQNNSNLIIANSSRELCVTYVVLRTWPFVTKELSSGYDYTSR